jgi:5-formyltetrahydrofolate cyclo-ligase
MERNALRRLMRERRDELSDVYRAASDSAICEILLDLPEYRMADMIFCYIGVRSEVDTLFFIRKALEGGKRVCAPALTRGGLMTAKEISRADDVAPADFGLFEPRPGCPETPADEISLAIVPCICCDRDGNRLGYGGGYYDRYLSRFKSDTVALCREANICGSGAISPLPHDVRAGIVVTERGAFRNCGRDCLSHAVPPRI